MAGLEMRARFVVPIHDLDVTARPVLAGIPATWLAEVLAGSEMVPAGPDGALDLEVSRLGNEVLVRGTVAVSVHVPCARCLDLVRFDCAAPLSLLLVRKGGVAGSDRQRGPTPVEFLAEEADTDTYDGDEVVLDPFVREAILLEAPVFPLCSEACEGIRASSEKRGPREGEDGRVDPRLRPLLRFSKNSKKGMNEE